MIIKKSQHCYENVWKKPTTYVAVTGHSESNKEQQPLFDRTRVLTRRSYRHLFAKIPKCSSTVKEKPQKRALPFWMIY